MDSHFALASKDDVWRLQTEMKNVYATQAEHADRLARLEHQRHDAEARMKSPWGTTSHSPFQGPINGPTPQGKMNQQAKAKTSLTHLRADRSYNPVSEDFRNFDQNLLGSLQLDADDVEPRRGTSRANSVRFDVSAGTHGARGSPEYLPLRTGSAFGSHPMTERSSSHKSEGRQSSAGQSNHSARASSFGYETRPLSATVAPFVPHGTSPGLFILGPVPSIIRCWLNENFRSEAMLYAAVCTGSYKSIVDSNLLSRLGYEDEILTNREGQRHIKLPVYLPEATLKTASSRSSSPAHQLPTLTTDFDVHDFDGEVGSMQIFLGCDVLRARNADIHFSLDRLTLFDDERNMVSVQLVRPENAAIYQRLQTTSVTNGQSPISAAVSASQASNDDPPSNETAGDPISDSVISKEDEFSDASKAQRSADLDSVHAAPSPSVIGEGRKPTSGRIITEASETMTNGRSDLKDYGALSKGSTPDTPTRPESNNVWSSWRRDSKSGTGTEGSVREPSSSGYQRPGRGRGMKVLKPARLNTSRSSSIQQQPVGFEGGDPRTAASPAQTTENHSPASDKRTFSAEARVPLQPSNSKPRSANPVGGASAFGWLNSGQTKQSTGASA